MCHVSHLTSWFAIRQILSFVIRLRRYAQLFTASRFRYVLLLGLAHRLLVVETLAEEELTSN
jgi:hypothetical protein